MKKAIAIIVSLIFVLSFAGLVAAEKAMDKAPAADQKAADVKAPAKVKQVTGAVAAIDAKANTVTVKGRKGDVVVTVGDKTKITMDKEKKSLADVKAGDKVIVKYSEADGKNMAKSIAIQGAKADKKAEPAKPADKK